MSTSTAIRQARQFAAAQYAYDNRDEPDYDDAMTEDDARDLAREELLSTPAVVADALAVICDPEWSPNSDPREFPGRAVHDVAKLVEELDWHGLDATALQPHQLLALAMLGDDRSAMDALRELRNRVERDLAQQIDERAQEMLRAQEREQERMRDEWLSEQQETA